MKKFIPLFFVLFIISCSFEPKPYVPDFTSEEGKKDFVRWAFIMSQNFVKENLKSPSTAKFPFQEYSWSDPDTKNNSVMIKSFVDSQNGFGAEIRTTYFVTVKFKGGLAEDINNWILQDLKFKN